MAEHELNKIVDDDGEVFNLRDSTKQPVADRVTSWSSTTSDTKYPSEKLVKTSIDSSVLYANQKWGGAFRISLSPIDVFGMMGHNVFLGAFASCIKVEYSTDGGTTWLDYGLTDTQKMTLFSQFNNSAIAYCGKNTHIQPGYTGTIAGTKDLTNEIIANQRLRITISSRPFANEGTTSRTGEFAIITRIRRLGILMSTQSASAGTHCVISTRSTANFEAGNDVWVTHGDFAILGDSGWNSIPCDNGTAENGFTFGGYGTGGAAQYNEIRFEIWSTQLSANPASSQTGNLAIYTICGLADKINSTNSKFHAFARYGYNCTSVDLANGYPVFGNGIKFTARKLKTNLARTADSTFDGSANQENIPVTGTLPLGNGGTGKTTAKAAEYNLTTGKSEISDTTSGDDRVVFELASPSESNGVTRGFRKLSTIWTWIKGLLSSESGVNISGSSASCTGNAATASAAQSGSALETAINGKMNTSASNATAPSGSGGDGATATLLNNLTEGISDIVTTDDGDNVLIATTDNGGSVTNKWYKRKLVKLVPWIIKKLGNQLVYDCGTGSTSTTDFNNAVAAFNAGQWVIIHSSSGVYYCVGTYSGGLRFKKLSNEASLLKVDTITWNSGSAPTAGNQIEASLSGHTHGNVTSDGKLQTDAEAIGSGDSLVVTDYSNSAKIARTSVSFDGTTTTKALTPKGTWETFMTPSAGNAASGALQNLTGQLTEGTSDFTDKTEIFTSYAGNNGFAESGHVNQPYRRKASSMLNYIESKRFYTRNPAQNDVGTGTKRIQLGYALKTGAGYCNYLVHVFFNSVAGSLTGCGVTLLVNYDWNTTSQKAKCVILNDNGLRAAGYNIVLANFLSNDGTNQWMHITLGLVNNSAPGTLVAFTYSYCGIFRVNSDVNWVPSIASDTVGSYDQLVQAVLTDADTVDGYHIQFGSYSSRSDTISFY